MPKLDFAFLADAAEAQPGRKFYVLGGGIDSIGAPGFPVVHPMISLVLRVLIHPTEADRTHTIEIKLMDADGRQLASIDGSLSGGSLDQRGREIPMPMVLNFMSTRFEAPGDYSFEILMNNQHLKSIPLRVHKVEVS